MSIEILTILTGAVPIGEVRAALPLGLYFGFAPLKAYLLAVLGNILPVIPALFGLHYFSGWLMKKSYWLNRFFNWLFKYTRDKHEAYFKKYEEKHHHVHWQAWVLPIALFVFVAIPLPMTGVWSGIAAAFVFNIPFWRAVLAISLGAATAGLIMLLLSLGIIGIF